MQVARENWYLKTGPRNLETFAKLCASLAKKDLVAEAKAEGQVIFLRKENN